MYRLGPTSWLGPLGSSQQAEITLRCTIALPAIPLSMYGGSVATSSAVRVRETFLLDAAESSAITGWLTSLRNTWHWNDDTRWEVFGSGQPDLTQLVFRPRWSSPGSRLPFAARLAVLTGWRTRSEGEPLLAIQVSLDLMLNLIELDADRQRDSIRHATTPAPAPAALTLEEVAAYLAELMEVIFLADRIGSELFPEGPLVSGYIGAWIDVSGVQLDCVLKLDDVSRLEGANGPAGYAAVSEWPIPTGDTPHTFIANLMDEMLEVGGYRGVQNRFDWLREGRPPQ